ncbi:MAG: hypothetical protein ABI718_11000, partial [Acidobacteriota bacterium]
GKVEEILRSTLRMTAGHRISSLWFSAIARKKLTVEHVRSSLKLEQAMLRKRVTPSGSEGPQRGGW